MDAVLSPFLMDKTKYYADFFIIPIMMVLALSISIKIGMSWLWPLLAICGWLAWTFIEYAIHRFVFHGRNRFAREHAKHHRHEAEYIGVTSFGTLLGFGITGAALWLTIEIATLPIMFGLMGGYLAYIVVHDLMHHSEIEPASMLFAIKQHHVGHHHGRPGNYGVSTRLWDSVFGTLGR